MGISHTNGKYGNISTVLALPDGHPAGDKNGHDHTSGAIYATFYYAGHPLRNDCGGHIKPKGDGPYACIEGLDQYGKMQVIRPQDMLADIMAGVYHSGIPGSDCVFNQFPKDIKPFLAGPQLLDWEGHEAALKKVLESNGLEYVLGIRVRPTVSGFAVPADWTMDTPDGERKILTVDDMKCFAEYHMRKFYDRKPVLVAEYTGFADAALAAKGIKHWVVEPSAGSTENRLRGRADMILETVETGSGLKRVDARLLYPAVSIHHPVLVMRKDTPPAARKIVYEIRDLIDAGQKKLEDTEPMAVRIKLDYGLVGWDAHDFKLPDQLDRMLAARY